MDLGGEFARLLGGVAVGNADEHDESGALEAADDVAADGDGGFADALHDGAHAVVSIAPYRPKRPRFFFLAGPGVATGGRDGARGAGAVGAAGGSSSMPSEESSRSSAAVSAMSPDAPTETLTGSRSADSSSSSSSLDWNSTTGSGSGSGSGSTCGVTWVASSASNAA